MRELKAAKGYYDMRLRDAEVAQAMADQFQRKADRFFCEAWHAAAFSGQSLQPSPTIEQALNAGFGILEVRCSRCNRDQGVELSTMDCLPTVELWKLEASFNCRRCRRETGWRSQAHIVGLRFTGREPPPAASKGRVSV